MSWLLIAILAYLFLAIASLFDRYFLVGSIPSPKTYTFYIGLLCFLGLFLIPFGVSWVKLIPFLFLGLAAGFVRIFAVLFMAKGIVKSEVSKVVPIIGGFLPIFTFLLFLPQQRELGFFQITAFILLVLGSVLISLKKTSFSLSDLKYPILASFLFSLAYFLAKMLFLELDFLNSGFLIFMGGGLGALSFLLFPRSRKIIFSQKVNQKMSGLFVLGQAFGGLGIISIYYAAFLARSSQVPLITALEGIKYVFLLFFVFLLAKKSPQVLKEKLSWQKLIAILLIGAGLALLSLNL